MALKDYRQLALDITSTVPLKFLSSFKNSFINFYQWVKGATFSLSIFGVLSQFIGLFAIYFSLYFTLPISLLVGLLLMFYMRHKRKRNDLKLAILTNQIARLQKHNLATQKLILHHFALEFSELTAESPTDLSLPVTPREIPIVDLTAEEKDYCSEVGKFFAKKPEQEDTRVGFISGFSQFILDTGFATGTILFAVTLFSAVPFVGLPLVLTLVTGVVIGLLIYFYIHREEKFHQANIKMAKAEISRQSEFAVYQNTLHKILTKKSPPVFSSATTENLVITSEAPPLTSSAVTSSAGTSDFTTARSLSAGALEREIKVRDEQAQSYCRQSIASGRYFEKLHLLEDKIELYLMLNRAIKVPTQATPANSVELKDLLQGDRKTLFLSRLNRLGGFFNRNITTALKMLLVLRFAQSEPQEVTASDQGKVMATLEYLAKRARSHSLFRRSELADEIEKTLAIDVKKGTKDLPKKNVVYFSEAQIKAYSEYEQSFFYDNQKSHRKLIARCEKISLQPHPRSSKSAI